MQVQVRLENRKLAGQLASFLRGCGLDHLLAAYGSEATRTRALGLDISFLPEPQATATEFLLLGQAVESERVRDRLPPEIVLGLQGLGLASEEDGFVRLKGIRLVRHLGVWVFCEAEHAGMSLYYGDDSLALGRLLAPIRGRALDLCTGVGSQGLLCALTAEQVVCVEKNPAVSDLFHLNAALNGLSDKVELRIGDLCDAVRGERFDYVCCNPPLLPIPQGIPYPFVGDGGPDGQAVVRRILQALPSLLSDTGRCQIVGTMPGDADGPDLSSLTCGFDPSFDILLVLPARESLGPQSRMVDALAYTAAAYSGKDFAAMREAFVAGYEAQKRGYLYSFLLLAQPAVSGGRGQVRISPHFLRNVEFWRV